jgi:putative ABC transport system permease protein
VLAAGRRAARVRPTLALQDSAVEPRLLGPIRVLGGLVALGGGIALLIVSTSTTGDTASTTAAVTAFVLVIAAAFLGPLAARAAALLPGALVARIAPAGGFLAVANLRTSARRFSAASTPLVLSVAMAFALLFVNTTQDHATNAQTRAGLRGELEVTGDLTPSALAHIRATKGVESAAALTPTSLGPSLGSSDDTLPANVLDGAGGGIELGVVAGRMSDLRGDAIALGRQRADQAPASSRSTSGSWRSATWSSPPRSPPGTAQMLVSGASASPPPTRRRSRTGSPTPAGTCQTASGLPAPTTRAGRRSAG